MCQFVMTASGCSDADAEALVNAVTTIGVMGKGVAPQSKARGRRRARARVPAAPLAAERDDRDRGQRRLDQRHPAPARGRARGRRRLCRRRRDSRLDLAGEGRFGAHHRPCAQLTVASRRPRAVISHASSQARFANARYIDHSQRGRDRSSRPRCTARVPWPRAGSAPHPAQRRHRAEQPRCSTPSR